MIKIKCLKIASVVKDLEQVELSYISGGTVNLKIILENYWQDPQKLLSKSRRMVISREWGQKKKSSRDTLGIQACLVWVVYAYL